PRRLAAPHAPGGPQRGVGAPHPRSRPRFGRAGVSLPRMRHQADAALVAELLYLPAAGAARLSRRARGGGGRREGDRVRCNAQRMGIVEVPHMNVSPGPLVVPPIDDFPAAYFAQHQTDIDTLLAHLRLFDIALGEDSVVLELAAGTGMHTGFLSHHFGRVLATDVFKYTALRNGTFVQHVAAEHAKYA